MEEGEPLNAIEEEDRMVFKPMDAMIMKKPSKILVDSSIQIEGDEMDELKKKLKAIEEERNLAQWKLECLKQKFKDGGDFSHEGKKISVNDSKS